MYAFENQKENWLIEILMLHNLILPMIIIPADICGQSPNNKKVIPIIMLLKLKFKEHTARKINDLFPKFVLF